MKLYIYGLNEKIISTMKNILLLGALVMFAFTTSAQTDAPATESKAKTEKSSCTAKADGEKKACCAKSATGEKKSCSSEEKAACSGKKDGKACCASASTGDKKTCSAEEKAACAAASKDGKACCAKTDDAKSSEKPKVKTKTVKATDAKISN